MANGNPSVVLEGIIDEKRYTKLLSYVFRTYSMHLIILILFFNSFFAWLMANYVFSQKFIEFLAFFVGLTAFFGLGFFIQRLSRKRSLTKSAGTFVGKKQRLYFYKDSIVWEVPEFEESAEFFYRDIGAVWDRKDTLFFVFSRSQATVFKKDEISSKQWKKLQKLLQKNLGNSYRA